MTVITAPQLNHQPSHICKEKHMGETLLSTLTGDVSNLSELRRLCQNCIVLIQLIWKTNIHHITPLQDVSRHDIDTSCSLISCQDMTILTSMEADVVGAFAEYYETVYIGVKLSNTFYYYKADMLWVPVAGWAVWALALTGCDWLRLRWPGRSLQPPLGAQCPLCPAATTQPQHNS